MSPGRNPESDLLTLGVTRLAVAHIVGDSDQAGVPIPRSRSCGRPPRRTSTSGRRRCGSVLGRVGLFVLAFGAAVMLAAACDGGPSRPGVAAIGTSSSTTVPAPAIHSGPGTSDYQLALTFSQCMRSHGVSNFPDPSSRGEFNNDQGLINGQSVDTSSPQFSAASKACEQLLPNGGQPTPAEHQQALAQALKYVQCMRAHGVAMLGPSTSGGGVGVGLGAGVNPNSTQFQSAEEACRSLQPGGAG
jgi:hypothetical protein